jgi:CRP-like cAMP-binding protein
MIDFEQLRKVYHFGKDLSVKDIQAFFKAAEKLSFKKKEILIHEGTKNNTVFYIRKGLVRCYYVNDKGDEITFRLIPEHDMVINSDLILFNQPSKFYYQAFESTKTYAIDYDILQAIIANNGTYKSNRKFVYQELLRQAQQRIESFVLYTPEERYELYLKDFPNLVNRVPDKYIANILGITPVSLSRIRKRIASKK